MSSLRMSASCPDRGGSGAQFSIVRVTKVKGHAEDSDVQSGRVRLVDQQGNAEADTAADLGRRHQSEVLIDVRQRLLKARSHWNPNASTALVYGCCC